MFEVGCLEQLSKDMAQINVGFESVSFADSTKE